MRLGGTRGCKTKDWATIKKRGKDHRSQNCPGIPLNSKPDGSKPHFSDPVLVCSFWTDRPYKAEKELNQSAEVEEALQLGFGTTAAGVLAWKSRSGSL